MVQSPQIFFRKRRKRTCCRLISVASLECGEVEPLQGGVILEKATGKFVSPPKEGEESEGEESEGEEVEVAMAAVRLE